ncbi:hypothetical protein [Hymenobacter sp.]|uniref:hypothetical protein n=1 Tax=Hymenobacter sp. TaxID=1898978 RepID=UPI00286AADEB|nr:hypothetical protein [Hymenobacter sp.]
MKLLLLFLLHVVGSHLAAAQKTAGAAADSAVITVFLKHQQDKNLKQLQEIQEKNGFWEVFPPKEARVVSWYVMMGIGQVVTLKVAAKDVRALNLAVENGAWGAFTTEFYPTYDFVPIWRETLRKRRSAEKR